MGTSSGGEPKALVAARSRAPNRASRSSISTSRFAVCPDASITPCSTVSLATCSDLVMLTSPYPAMLSPSPPRAGFRRPPLPLSSFLPLATLRRRLDRVGTPSPRKRRRLGRWLPLAYCTPPVSWARRPPPWDTMMRGSEGTSAREAWCVSLEPSEADQSARNLRCHSKSAGEPSLVNCAQVRIVRQEGRDVWDLDDISPARETSWGFCFGRDAR